MIEIIKKLLFLISFVLLKFNTIYSQIIKNDSIILNAESIKYINLFKDSVSIENPYELINIGYLDLYMGNNQRGNEILNFALNNILKPDSEIYHELSVQNTKNGNYQIGFNYLNQAAELNPEVYGYFGWVMLYYYRDYVRAIKYLEKYDSLTPNFVDYPIGENIHFLKGLAYLQLKSFEIAIFEFNNCIDEITNKNGENWVEESTFYYIGLCYQMQKNYKKAIWFYNKAIKYNKFYTEAYYQRGLCRLELNNLKKFNKDLLHSRELIMKGYRKSDSYLEIFHPVYLQDIEKYLLINKKAQ